MLKKLLSDRCSYKQEELMRGCLNKTYDAHNGLEDVKSLRDLLLHLKPQNAVLALHSFLYVCESIQHNHRITTNFSSFKDLVSKKVLSKAMAKNKCDSFMLEVDMTVSTVYWAQNKEAAKVNAEWLLPGRSWEHYPTICLKNKYLSMQCLHAYIYTFIEAPFTELFSHNMLKLKNKTKEKMW